MNRGREKFAAEDYDGAERVFRSCLSRISSTRNLVSLQRNQSSKSRLMELLLKTYFVQRRWSEAQSLLQERIARGSHEMTGNGSDILAETLMLVGILIMQKFSAEALLYGRRALKGYRKLGSQGIGGVALSLRAHEDICSMDKSLADEEEAYSAMLSQFLQSHPQHKDASHSLSSISIHIGTDAWRYLFDFSPDTPIKSPENYEVAHEAIPDIAVVGRIAQHDQISSDEFLLTSSARTQACIEDALSESFFPFTSEERIARKKNLEERQVLRKEGARKSDQPKRSAATDSSLSLKNMSEAVRREEAAFGLLAGPVSLHSRVPRFEDRKHLLSNSIFSSDHYSEGEKKHLIHIRTSNITTRQENISIQKNAQKSDQRIKCGSDPAPSHPRVIARQDLASAAGFSSSHVKTSRDNGFPSAPNPDQKSPAVDSAPETQTQNLKPGQVPQTGSNISSQPIVSKGGEPPVEKKIVLLGGPWAGKTSLFL